LRGAYRAEVFYLELFRKGLYFWAVMVTLITALELFFLDTISNIAQTRCETNVFKTAFSDLASCVVSVSNDLKVGTAGLATVIVLFYVYFANSTKRCCDQLA